jgi:hypothetical protein
MKNNNSYFNQNKIIYKEIVMQHKLLNFHKKYHHNSLIKV